MSEPYTILTGDVRTSLAAIPDKSVQLCVTSPPYFGLRAYCDDPAEIGREKTIAAYVGNLVDVFREIKRVLRDDGVIFVNLGDSYSGSGKGGGGNRKGNEHGQHDAMKQAGRPPAEVPPKSLCGIPWRVAFALQDDGWILRSDIIWAKPAPMPESVTDRCTKSHEYIFMLAKKQKYYYDNEAIKEPAQDWGERDRSNMRDGTTDGLLKYHGLQNINFAERGRNKRDVWSVNTECNSLPHYAMMPKELIKPCVLAGTSEAGQCSECGKPWVRVVEKSGGTWQERVEAGAPMRYRTENLDAQAKVHLGGSNTTTMGWRPTCNCNAPTEPQIVLDPFSGMATVGVVALGYGRRYIGCELNPEYAAMSEKRLRDVPRCLDFGGGE